jgi:hypothetical protein
MMPQLRNSQSALASLLEARTGGGTDRGDWDEQIMKFLLVLVPLLAEICLAAGGTDRGDWDQLLMKYQLALGSLWAETCTDGRDRRQPFVSGELARALFPPESQARPSGCREARKPSPARGQAMRECEVEIPYHGSGNISDGSLHDAEAWSWLQDQLYAELDGGFTNFKWVPSTGHGRRFRVVLSASAVGRLKEILAEACERFYCERIKVVFPDRGEIEEVPHR